MQPSARVLHLLRTGRLARATQQWRLEKEAAALGLSHRRLVLEYGRPPLEPEPESVVYLVGSSVPPVDGEPVKIGYTRNIRQRLEELQPGSVSKLWLIAYVQGGKALEAEIHAELSERRIREDWFSMCEAVRDAFSVRIEEQVRGCPPERTGA